jgi:tetraacyldisaccharide 4'-kinase
MADSALHRRLMAGDDVWTLPLRGVLWACSGLYGVAVARRNRRYDRGDSIAKVDAPVISVGNITTGGTGKTPLVIDIGRRLQQLGRKVGVLSRGYKAGPDQAGDELQLVARRLPEAVCVADPDRTAAAKRAIAEQRVDAIVLDDGFQHRRLHRDLDVVAIDATRPFGFGHLLPRGLLREPLRSLRRAGLIVVTRADQVDADTLRALHARLGEIAPQVPRLSCRHEPSGLVELGGEPSEVTIEPGCGVFCFSAIGNPDAFEATVRQMGAQICGYVRLPDHHRYQSDDLARIAQEAKRGGAALVLTTEKDAVKVANLAFDWPLPALAVRVEVTFLDDGDTILQRILERTLVAACEAQAATTGAKLRNVKRN